MRPRALFLLLAILVSGCHDDSPVSQDSVADASQQTDEAPQELPSAIDRSARYLAHACDTDGKFTYRICLDPTDEFEPQYNVLRHAGAIYALAQYNQRSKDHAAKAAMLRAARFLWQRCVAPVAGNPNLLAVWSEPELVGPNQPRQAKLGGTGLGLIAFLSVHQTEPRLMPVEQLRKLGRFLIYMQKPDGSFYSKYYLESGRSDLWQSMYYPGEAALGLLMLYETDPAEHWLHAATKALENLALRGVHQHPTPPDQWYLLSLKQWCFSAADRYEPAVRGRLTVYAQQLCRDMVHEQQAQLNVAEISGCFTPEGRTCPTATRLEGLIAALQFLPPGDTELRPDIRRAVDNGMRFLLDSQVADGPHAGALPRFKLGFRPSGLSDAEVRRMKEVRIDYVQHALSAMVAYERELLQRRLPSSTGPAENGGNE